MYIYIYTHTYIHTYIHIYIYRERERCLSKRYIRSDQTTDDSRSVALRNMAVRSLAATETPDESRDVLSSSK